MGNRKYTKPEKLITTIDYHEALLKSGIKLLLLSTSNMVSFFLPLSKLGKRYIDMRDASRVLHKKHLDFQVSCYVNWL